MYTLPYIYIAFHLNTTHFDLSSLTREVQDRTRLAAPGALRHFSCLNDLLYAYITQAMHTV